MIPRVYQPGTNDTTGQSAVAVAPGMSLCAPGDGFDVASTLARGAGIFNVVVAQLDNIRARWALDHLCREAVRVLEIQAKHRRMSSWPALFFLTFTIQESTGYLTRDVYLLWTSAAGPAADADTLDKQGPRLPHWDDISAMHGAADTVLALWHHFNRATEANTLQDRQRSPMCDVDPGQFVAIRVLYTLVSTWRRSAIGKPHSIPLIVYACPNNVQVARFQSVYWPMCPGLIPCTLRRRCSRARSGGRLVTYLGRR